jgi:hypothetical protein
MVMKEFAKRHVEAALEAAYNNARTQDNILKLPVKGGFGNVSVPFKSVNKESILSAYPLENIK